MGAINTYRKENNFTWSELSKQMGVEQRTLQQVDADGSSGTQVDTALKIQGFTGLPFHAFIKGVEELEKLANDKKK